MATPTDSHAAGTELDIGVKSWTTERFGSDVAVLRNDDAAVDATAPAARFLLSCVGPDRRFRLTLPSVISAAHADGSAVIMTADRAGRPLAVRFRLTDASTIVIDRGSASAPDISLAIGQMLLTRPRALDLFLSLGPNPVAFTKLKLVRVLLSLKPESVDAVARFVDACGRFAGARNN